MVCGGLSDLVGARGWHRGDISCKVGAATLNLDGLLGVVGDVLGGVLEGNVERMLPRGLSCLKNCPTLSRPASQ